MSTTAATATNPMEKARPARASRVLYPSRKPPLSAWVAELLAASRDHRGQADFLGDSRGPGDGQHRADRQVEQDGEPRT